MSSGWMIVSENLMPHGCLTQCLLKYSHQMVDTAGQHFEKLDHKVVVVLKVTNVDEVAMVLRCSVTWPKEEVSPLDTSLLPAISASCIGFAVTEGSLST